MCLFKLKKKKKQFFILLHLLSIRFLESIAIFYGTLLFRLFHARLYCFRSWSIERFQLIDRSRNIIAVYFFSPICWHYTAEITKVPNILKWLVQYNNNSFACVCIFIPRSTFSANFQKFRNFACMLNILCRNKQISFTQFKCLSRCERLHICLKQISFFISSSTMLKSAVLRGLVLLWYQCKVVD